MSNLDAGIKHAMASVRGVKVYPDTVELVRGELASLLQKAEEGRAEPVVVQYLQEAEESFGTGNIDGAVQRLSRALLRVTLSSPRTSTG